MGGQTPEPDVVGKAATADPLAHLLPEQVAQLQSIVEGLEHEGVFNGRASANPLPGPLFEAFDPEPVAFAGIAVRAFVPFDFVVLRKLESPLLRRFEELFKPVEQRTLVTFTDEEEAAMLFQFTTSVSAVRATIERGVQHFRSHAGMQIARGGLPGLVRPQLIALIQKQYVRTWSTAISYCATLHDTAEVHYSASVGSHDGLGWWLNYVAAALVRLPWDTVMYQLPIAQGRALICAWQERDPLLDMERSSAGYLAQEIARLKAQERPETVN